MLHARTSGFNSPGAGEAGLRVSRCLLGVGAAWRGPVLPTGSSSSRCSVPGADQASLLPWQAARPHRGEQDKAREGENRKSCGQNSQGNHGFTKPCHDPCCCPSLAEPYLSVAQVCCLAVCRVCWPRCKRRETDCRDCQTARHTRAGTCSRCL